MATASFFDGKLCDQLHGNDRPLLGMKGSMSENIRVFTTTPNKRSVLINRHGSKG
jgi:hypothetical protein